MQLLQHFKELTIHPKNAQELKGLILQLAIQGKLTQKWREERRLSGVEVEPASVLLEKIKAEKEQLIKEKKIKKEKPLPEIKGEEIPFELPKGWKWCRFGTLSKILNGRAYKKQELLEDSTLTPVLRVGNLFTSNSWYYSDIELEPDKYIDKGDLIYAWSASFGPFIWKGSKAIYHYHIWKLDHTNFVNKDYLKLFLDSETEKIKASGSGIAMVHMTKGKMELLLTKLPPLEEQKAIVATVNQLFAEVDQLEERTKARVQLKNDFVTSALRKLTEAQEVNGEWAFLQHHFKAFFNTKESVKKLRESILQLAVQGKLTTHWRSENPKVESASVLLEKIKAEKAQLITAKKIKKEKALPEISEDEIPFELPASWVWCRLGTVTDIIAGASFKSGDFNSIGGTKCIKITNAGVREFIETEDYLPANFQDKYPVYLIKEGDLILALTRPYIKDGLKISLCPATYNNSLLNQRVASIRSMTEMLFHVYVFVFIQSPHVLSYYKMKFDDKSQQPNMKMADITNLTFALPPLEEQKVIVAKVNSLMALCDKLEQEIEQNTQQVEDLMKSCLKEVFEG